jgi:hypothetical protein
MDPAPPPPAAPGVIRAPLATKVKPDFLVFEVLLTVAVRGAGGKFFPLPFLLDTGVDYTTIPRSVADHLGVELTARTSPGPVLTLALGGR